jgi:hypothetical protein
MPSIPRLPPHAPHPHPLCCADGTSLGRGDPLAVPWEELDPSSSSGHGNKAALEQLLAIAGFCIPAPSGPVMGAVRSRHRLLVALNKYVRGAECGGSDACT